MFNLWLDLVFVSASVIFFSVEIDEMLSATSLVQVPFVAARSIFHLLSSALNESRLTLNKHAESVGTARSITFQNIHGTLSCNGKMDLNIWLLNTVLLIRRFKNSFWLRSAVRYNVCLSLSSVRKLILHSWSKFRGVVSQSAMCRF